MFATSMMWPAAAAKIPASRRGDSLVELLTTVGLDLGVRVVVEHGVDVWTSVSAHLEPTRQKTLGTPHPQAHQNHVTQMGVFGMAQW